MNGHGALTGHERLARLETRARVVGLAGLAALAAGGAADRVQFFHSYLAAFVFVAGVALGSLALVMLHHMTGGAWGLMIRRLSEGASRTLPLVALMFVPLALGLRYLYAWADPAGPGAHGELAEVIAAKRLYLNPGFFLLRAAAYFVVWTLVAALLNRWSLAQDRTPPQGDERHFRLLSGPGLVVYGLTVTFAGVDWIMSIDVAWFSTIFGLLLMAGQALSAMAFAIAALALLSHAEPFAGRVRAAHFHDLGKLLFALVLLWAYLTFSQFLIIWSGNLPEEIPWYLDRMREPWQAVSALVVVGHFLLPFLVLLSRDVKRKPRVLAAVAVGILAMRFVDTYWLIVPSFPAETARIHWMDLAALAGLGGVWLAAWCRTLRTRSLLPMNDPYLEDALAHGGH